MKLRKLFMGVSAFSFAVFALASCGSKNTSEEITKDKSAKIKYETEEEKSDLYSKLFKHFYGEDTEVTPEKDEENRIAFYKKYHTIEQNQKYKHLKDDQTYLCHDDKIIYSMSEDAKYERIDYIENTFFENKKGEKINCFTLTTNVLLDSIKNEYIMNSNLELNDYVYDYDIEDSELEGIGVVTLNNPKTISGNIKVTTSGDLPSFNEGFDLLFHACNNLNFGQTQALQYNPSTIVYSNKDASYIYSENKIYNSIYIKKNYLTSYVGYSGADYFYTLTYNYSTKSTLSNDLSTEGYTKYNLEDLNLDKIDSLYPLMGGFVFSTNRIYESFGTLILNNDVVKGWFNITE